MAVNPFMGRGGAGGVSVPLQLRQTAGGIAPQVTARGRQLQTAAPTIPRSSFAQGAANAEKSIDSYLKFQKETRQKQNRENVVKNLMSDLDAPTESMPSPSMNMEGPYNPMGGEAEADSFDVAPKVNRLDVLGKDAKNAFTTLANAGLYDEAFKVWYSTATKAPERMIVKDGDDVFQVNTDGSMNLIASNPKTMAPTKTAKPTILYDKKLGRNRPVTNEEQVANPENFTTASDPNALINPDGSVNKVALEANKQIQKAGRPTPKEKQEIKIAEGMVDELQEIRKQARGAQRTIRQMDGIASALDRLESFEGTTGVGREEFSKVKNFLNTIFGKGTFDENVLASEELVIVEGGKIAMTFIEQTKGAITERENAMFKSFAPNLSKTPQGNRLIIAYAKAAAEAQAEESRLASAYRAQNDGVFDDGFDKYRDERITPYKQRLNALLMEARNMSGGMTPEESALGGGNSIILPREYAEKGYKIKIKDN